MTARIPGAVIFFDQVPHRLPATPNFKLVSPAIAAPILFIYHQFYKIFSTYGFVLKCCLMLIV